MPAVGFGQRMSNAVAATQLGRLQTPVRLGDEQGLRVQRVCPNGACGALRLVRPDGSANVTQNVPVPFWLTPGELHLFYQLPADSVKSPAPTIAVIEEGVDLTAESDLSSYSNHFGIPNCISSCFNEYYGTFTPSTYSAESLPSESDLDTAGETTLDLDAVHATCENCPIMLVQVDTSAATTGDQVLADMAAATAWAANHGGPGNTGASVISFSYSPTSLAFHYPQPTGTYSAGYANFAQRNRVIVASSGDAGYGQAFAPYAGPFPAYPASNPHVVAAGGTTLSANADGTYAGESVWNDSAGSSGSGCGYIDNTYYASTWTYTAPAWQKADPYFGTESCYYRTVADVSADGDPATGLETYQTYNPNVSAWQVNGGTSLSAPLIAGMYALAGGYPTTAPSGGCLNTSTLDNCAAYAPYANQSDTVPALHDITAGNNLKASGASCGGTTLCNAGTGLDGPTGVGTPIGLAAFGGPSHPNATTQSAAGVTSSSATLSATVDPVGSSGTLAYFCYGLGDPYSGCGSNAAIGTSAQSVSQSLTGLSPSTTYHYRIYANGPGGLGIGADGTFTTSAAPPAPAPVGPPTPSIATWQSGQRSVSTTASCVGASSASCTIEVVATVTETLKHGKIVAVTAARRRRSATRTVVVARTTVTVPAGQSETVTLLLNSAGASLLKTHHALTAKLVATSAGAVLSSQTATFKLPAKARRPHKPGGR